MAVNYIQGHSQCIVVSVFYQSVGKVFAVTFVVSYFPRCQQQDRKQMNTNDHCTFSLFRQQAAAINFHGSPCGYNVRDCLVITRKKVCYPNHRVWMDDIDGLVQDSSNAIVLAMELLRSCTKPSIYVWLYVWHGGGNESLTYTAVLSDCIMASNRQSKIWIWLWFKANSRA